MCRPWAVIARSAPAGIRATIGLDARSVSSNQNGSDHAPLWQRNIPAIYVHECRFSPVYHTTDDTIQHISFSQITKATKAVAAAVVDLAIE